MAGGYRRDRPREFRPIAEHTRPDPAVVFSALMALREELPPDDPTSGGCVVAMVALIALVFMPLAVRFTSLSAGVLGAVGLGLGVLVVVGTVIGIFFGGSLRSAMAESVNDAVDALTDGSPDQDQAARIAAAVLILERSTTSAGPSTIPTFDRREVAQRLGPALPFVTDVERILLERDEIYPCFTLDD